jgi:hypothetical protein
MTEFRTILEELADEQPPSGLGPRALIDGRRRRRRGLGVAAAAVTALVALAVPVGVTAARNEPTAPITLAAPPAPSGYAILSYQQYAQDPTDPTYVWDKQTRAYVRVPWGVSASPDGQWALLYDGGSDQWGYARWADMLHRRNITWHARGADSVEWSSVGATLIKIDTDGRTTTYLDPASGQTDTAAWPAELGFASAGLDLGVAGVIRGDQVVFLSDKDLSATRAATIRWVVDRKGSVVDRSQIIFPRTRLVTGPDDKSHQQIVGYGGAGIAVSPDGRYVAVAPGHILDFQDGRSITFEDVVGEDNISAGFVVGWYDKTHVIQTARADRGGPVTLTIYDVAGHPVKTTALDTLPGKGAPGSSARTAVQLVPAGPDNVGAVPIGR